jgi:hypothetical protein
VWPSIQKILIGKEKEGEVWQKVEELLQNIGAIASTFCL